MRVFAISGLSGTGKTTLLERLVRELVRKGYSVATLKSTQEDGIREQAQKQRSYWDLRAPQSDMVAELLSEISLRTQILISS
jgi:molybdopterin-guanine dinucleotide biosynthesis protein MobB